MSYLGPHSRSLLVVVLSATIVGFHPRALLAQLPAGDEHRVSPQLTAPRLASSYDELARSGADVLQLEGAPSRSDAWRWGLAFDVGSVEGGMLSGVYRWRPELRLRAGAGTNGASLGLRAGVDLFPSGETWSLSLEGGHFFEGDARGLLSPFVGTSLEYAEFLKRVDYDFLSLQGGWELEAAGVALQVRLGASLLRSDLEQSLDTLNLTYPGYFGSGNTAWLLVPSMKIGFVGLL